MHVYRMKDQNDYRTAVNGQGHGIVLIKKDGEIEKAYGYFKTIDEDMSLVSEQEENEINTSLNLLF